MNLKKTREFLERYAGNYAGVPAGLDAAGALEELGRAEEVLRTAQRWTHDARAELRDAFAAAALTGLMSDSTVDLPSAEDYATKAYQMADAMLAAREGK